MNQTEQAYQRHEEATVVVGVSAPELFDFLDDHHNLSAHMEKSSSPMMGGGQMELILDDGAGRVLGSHVVMRGTAFGLRLFVDEIVVEHNPPVAKTWRTVAQRLIVIGRYSLGFTIADHGSSSALTVWIDYDLPERGRLLGWLGGRPYAKWCVSQMLNSALVGFPSSSLSSQKLP